MVADCGVRGRVELSFKSTIPCDKKGEALKLKQKKSPG